MLAVHEMNGDEAERSVRPNSVLARAATILDAFDGSTPVLSLSQLSTRTGLPKSTVHRFAEQLLGLGWFERAPGGYRVGMRLFEVGGLAERHSRMRDRALPYMLQLSATTRCGVHLAVLDHTEIVYLEKVPVRGLNLPTREGGRMPAYCTSLGKAMLAFADEDEIERVIAAGLDRRTPFTITAPDAFRADLEAVRRAGVATDREEACRGISCAAAPIRGSGRAIGAVSITGFAGTFDFRTASAAVKRATAAIWYDLFGSRPGDAESSCPTAGVA
ncbi:MAG TPA: IclR family transcriptional regulator [Acidimicrobiales bacterium]|nr:IclR family transcriptional regulator [Acidimicrobiales bacterium]